MDVGEVDAFKDYADYIMNESLKWIERFFKTGKSCFVNRDDNVYKHGEKDQTMKVISVKVSE